jgi:type IV pilus assembly protein PilW
MMRRLHFARRRGFSLVELMVGILLAMAAVLVVTQVFRVSEGQRRGTSGGDDAQTTGAIAVSLPQVALGGGRSIGTLAPVAINPAGIPAGDANTDVLQIAYGSGWGSPEGGLINLQTGPAEYVVPGSLSYQIGDRVIVTTQARATPCALTLTRVSAQSTPTTVTVATGVAGAANGVLFNLGQTPRLLAYAVRNSRLTVCDFMTQDCTSTAAQNWTEVADNIVSLRAQYARDRSNPRDGTADGYDTDNGTLNTPAAWGCLVGMRLALIARSRQPETADIPASAPTWAGAASSPLQPPGDDWRRYRYKTFETTVPLRNAPGAGEPAFSAC